MAPAITGATKKRGYILPFAGRPRREPSAQGWSYALESGWLYATHQTIPTMPSMARVDGHGLWRAMLHPNICLAPLEWGGVVALQGIATNALWLLAVAKLDGVIDYPNCRSRGGQPLRPWVSLMFGDCRSALPLTLILYHTEERMSIDFGQKYCTKFERFLGRKLCNLTNVS